MRKEEEVPMMNNYDSIRLFKKNREKEDRIQEQLNKEDLPNSETKIPELIIRPLESKDTDTNTNKGISSLMNSIQLPLSPKISEIIQNAFKDIFSLDPSKDLDVLRKLPIWSIFKKPQ